MKKFNKLSVKTLMAVAMALTTLTTVFAETALDTAVKPVAELIYALLNPALIIVGAVGSLYCVILGVKYAKCEEPQEREKAKGNLKNAIIGFVLIFVLMFLLKVLMPVMIDWTNDNVANVAAGDPLAINN